MAALIGKALTHNPEWFKWFRKAGVPIGEASIRSMTIHIKANDIVRLEYVLHADDRLADAGPPPVELDAGEAT